MDREDVGRVLPARYELGRRLGGGGFAAESAAPLPMSPNDQRALIDRYLAAYNDFDVDGMVALANRSTYGISKAAIIHMTRMLAIEWAPHNITLNAIAPGTIETPSRGCRPAAAAHPTPVRRTRR